MQVSCDDCGGWICQVSVPLPPAALSQLFFCGDPLPPAPCPSDLVKISLFRDPLLTKKNVQTCHWCHEYQANHSIRVCDRCDAFYCRQCDEMDQCEDCSEVVCGGCSTLMSCKFCGCGLCEDCATACGRCGIVLCARDAKFAVECDTCR